MLTTDRLAGGALSLLALAVLFESRRLPLGTLRNPGPAYLPVVLAALLLLSGLALVALGGRAPRPAALGWGEARHAAAIVTAVAVAALLLERLGYRLTMALMLLFLVGVVERRGGVTAALFAAALALGSFLLFDTVLRVPLPRGALGF
jgi:putative tricarboxylic transport membrane protein